MVLETSERQAGIWINLALVIVSAALWAVFWFANSWAFATLHYTTGISLVYFPAGVRLLIVLVFGVWGAIGIALSNPLLFLFEFGSQSVPELLVDSLIAGFVPLLAARACQKLLGIGSSLENLRPVHLPILALAVSIATPLAFNLMFLAYGLKPLAELPRNVSAMALGDFLGCMIALMAAMLVLMLLRRLREMPEG